MSEIYQSLSHSTWDCKYHRCVRAQTGAPQGVRTYIREQEAADGAGGQS
jgi:hypothetical protein